MLVAGRDRTTARSSRAAAGGRMTAGRGFDLPDPAGRQPTVRGRHGRIVHHAPVGLTGPTDHRTRTVVIAAGRHGPSTDRAVGRRPVAGRAPTSVAIHRIEAVHRAVATAARRHALSGRRSRRRRSSARARS
jgi:hypothetical protein